VLTINGEKVALPRAEHLPAVVLEEPALTLESLTEAFNRVAPAAAEPQAGAAGAEGEEGAAQRAGRRRGRRHRSASRAQGAANESAVEQAGMDQEAGRGGAGHSFTAQAPAPETGGEKPKDEATKSGPVILGVGVPASEL
jgi:ribonuclease E